MCATSTPGHWESATTVPSWMRKTGPQSGWFQARSPTRSCAGQPPVPLGGPEQGVVTYPYILAQAKNKSKTPEQFFKILMGVYFTEEELLNGNLHGGGTHQALSPAIISAILTETKKQYGGVQVKLYRVVNEKCGRMRATLKARISKPVVLRDANQVQVGTTLSEFCLTMKLTDPAMSANGNQSSLTPHHPDSLQLTNKKRKSVQYTLSPEQL
uniref:BEN domain-containing protein n=1 Tax=Branchiostoma floridae TaxID=7739 RepID=C3ZUJ4_BRAFL|eukprot:XP_002587695.1 hypothetical protein BRAFLDRAFT_94598 [Branchiostoma floridae]